MVDQLELFCDFDNGPASAGLEAESGFSFQQKKWLLQLWPDLLDEDVREWAMKYNLINTVENEG